MRIPSLFKAALAGLAMAALLTTRPRRFSRGNE